MHIYLLIVRYTISYTEKAWRDVEAEEAQKMAEVEEVWQKAKEAEAAGAVVAVQSHCMYRSGRRGSEGVRGQWGSGTEQDCGVQEGEGTREAHMHKLPEEGRWVQGGLR